MQASPLPTRAVPESEWFHTAMCDLHHQSFGYMTKEPGRMTVSYDLLVVSGADRQAFTPTPYGAYSAERLG